MQASCFVPWNMSRFRAKTPGCPSRPPCSGCVCLLYLAGVLPFGRGKGGRESGLTRGGRDRRRRSALRHFGGWQGRGGWGERPLRKKDAVVECCGSVSCEAVFAFVLFLIRLCESFSSLTKQPEHATRVVDFRGWTTVHGGIGIEARHPVIWFSPSSPTELLCGEEVENVQSRREQDIPTVPVPSSSSPALLASSDVAEVPACVVVMCEALCRIFEHHRTAVHTRALV